MHWSLKFEAFTSLLGWDDAMTTAAMHGTEVSLQGVEQAVTETARALFSLLVAKCEGKAFGIVQLCPKGNGLEAWRRLKDEYEGRSGNRLAAMLRGILNPRERRTRDSDNNREFLESLNDWEILTSEYRAASGENVSDRVLVATILEHAPARYQDTLRAIPAQQMENYSALRRWIKTIVSLHVSMVSQASSEGKFRWTLARSKVISLERLRRARARTESRMASMSRERSSPRRDQATRRWRQRTGSGAVSGYCGFCEKWGHKRADCRKRQREQGPSSMPSVKSASALPNLNSAGDAVAQVATLTYSGEQPKEKDDRWCFAMTTDSNCQAVKGSVLIDSGSDEHVCRKEFAPAYETQPDPHPVTLRDVQKGVLQQYGVRDVSLQIGPSGITEAQCAFKVADVNDDVLSLGRLLRRGFEFDLSLGRGCSMFPRGRPDKAVPLFLHKNSLRLQALPLVRAISDCRPVEMEM